MTTLVPMRPQAFDAFFDMAVASYAEQNAAAGRWPEADAPELARAETGRLLAQGVLTPDHHLYEILDDAGTPVGYLWFGTLARGNTRVAFIYQVQVKPGHRRQGHARAALRALEALVAGMGLSGMALHVFGNHSGAQALYEAAGYSVTGVNMHKPLAAPAGTGPAITAATP